jgi:hypothetical protein
MVFWVVVSVETEVLNLKSFVGQQRHREKNEGNEKSVFSVTPLISSLAKWKIFQTCQPESLQDSGDTLNTDARKRIGG